MAEKPPIRAVDNLIEEQRSLTGALAQAAVAGTASGAAAVVTNKLLSKKPKKKS
jgi:hypothetical protein